MTYFPLSLFILTVYFWTAYSQDCAQSFISEVHANPLSLPDSEAEFIEIYQFADSNCSYQMSIDGQVLISELTIKESGFAYVSKTTEPKLLKSLPNSNSYRLILIQDSLSIDSVIAPTSQEGDSWERQFPISQDVPWISHSDQDKLEASPGYGAPRIQKQTQQCFWTESKAICNRYDQIFLQTFHSNTLNEWIEDSTTSLTQSVTVTSSNSPFDQFILVGDEYPIDNAYYSVNVPILSIENVNPISNDTLPEWIHIKSYFEMDHLFIRKEDTEYSVNNLPMGDCLLTKDSLSLSQFLGPIRHCIIELEKWPTLLNNRGELCLYLPQNSTQTHCFSWDENHFYSQDSMTKSPLVQAPFDLEPNNIKSVEISSRIWNTANPPEINLYRPGNYDSISLSIITLNGNKQIQEMNHYDNLKSKLNELLLLYKGQIIYLEITLGPTKNIFKLYVQ